MSHLNALHVHDVDPQQPPTGFWEEHSTQVITIGVMLVVTMLAWATWANWEIVQDTVLQTIR